MKTLLGVLLLTLGCTPIQPQPTPAYDCGTVCAHGRELGCDWAAWTPISNCITSCAEWRDTFYYDLKCMTVAATCEAAEKCQSHNFGAHRLSKKK